MSGCHFESNSAIGNSASGGGGGLHLIYGNSPPKYCSIYLTDCSFKWNVGGGVAFLLDGPCQFPLPFRQGGNTPIILSNSTFEGNVDVVDGGGVFIFFSNLNVHEDSPVSFFDCVFKNNIASGDGYIRKGLGGGIDVRIVPQMFQGNPTNNPILLKGCLFEGNSAANGGGFAFDIQSFGANWEDSPFSFKSCIFRNNTSGAGGGIYFRFLFNQRYALGPRRSPISIEGQ
jgi:hypothetical protein